MSDRDWDWLIDDYERGTVFITDDPSGSQRPIIEGITQWQAMRIIRFHNRRVNGLKKEIADQVYRKRVARQKVDEFHA